MVRTCLCWRDARCLCARFRTCSAACSQRHNGRALYARKITARAFNNASPSPNKPTTAPACGLLTGEQPCRGACALRRAAVGRLDLLTTHSVIKHKHLAEKLFSLTFCLTWNSVLPLCVLGWLNKACLRQACHVYVFCLLWANRKTPCFFCSLLFLHLFCLSQYNVYVSLILLHIYRSTYRMKTYHISSYSCL